MLHERKIFFHGMFLNNYDVFDDRKILFCPTTVKKIREF